VGRRGERNELTRGGDKEKRASAVLIQGARAAAVARILARGNGEELASEQLAAGEEEDKSHFAKTPLHFLIFATEQKSVDKSYKMI
jgi:hypothetical protein